MYIGHVWSRKCLIYQVIERNDGQEEKEEDLSSK